MFTSWSLDSFCLNLRETLMTKLPTVRKPCLCLFCHTVASLRSCHLEALLCCVPWEEA